MMTVPAKRYQLKWKLPGEVRVCQVVDVIRRVAANLA
jgi:hypothetical protein